MEISHHTASDHIKSVYRKLGVNSRAEATLEAVRMGIT
jgi:DNA-binding CsgD family transcriptional regulator